MARQKGLLPLDDAGLARQLEILGKRLDKVAYDAEGWELVDAEWLARADAAWLALDDDDDD
jgi:hypothetical protein